MNKIIVIGHGEAVKETCIQVQRAGLEAIVIGMDNHSLDALPYLLPPHPETAHERTRKFCQPHPYQIIKSREERDRETEQILKSMRERLMDPSTKFRNPCSPEMDMSGVLKFHFSKDEPTVKTTSKKRKPHARKSTSRAR